MMKIGKATLGSLLDLLCELIPWFTFIFLTISIAFAMLTNGIYQGIFCVHKSTMFPQCNSCDTAFIILWIISYIITAWIFISKLKVLSSDFNESVNPRKTNSQREISNLDQEVSRMTAELQRKLIHLTELKNQQKGNEKTEAIPCHELSKKRIGEGGGFCVISE